MTKTLRAALIAVPLCLMLLACAGPGPGTGTGQSPASTPRPAAEAAPPRPQTIGEQREAVLFWSQAQRLAGSRQMQLQFPSDVAAASTANIRELPAGVPLPGLAGDPDWLDAYMDSHDIAGLMVLHQGRLRLHRHGLGMKPTDRWESFSVAKSVTSTLLGIALRQGHIKSLDDLLVRYLPELEGSAYDQVSVRQLLTMTSGVRWNEDYTDPQSDVAQMYLGRCVDGQAHALAYLRTLPRAHPPGTRWTYNTAETDLLGLVVERATGQRLAHYLSQTIWQPYGMAADAYWIRDECDGSNTGGSGLSATLADYARLGQFMLEGGVIDGEPVIAADWMAGAVRDQDADNAPERGYGYQWWTDTGGAYLAAGIFGQMLLVDPQHELVIVQLAAWPQATSRELVTARRGLVEAVRRAVAERPAGAD
ncbi:MAG: serine hydrolase domain-containing protein [Lysobacterales bacterium]